ncbi:lasso RiPP family leader peptide-containing protein [Streptomyces hainanensis]|uniref:Lasso RiPP family leader peptide-containing protein n=1 Tax=Streptomyces hainanensis TaxID=402648 RepID=A0A4R4TLJ3_9ACTN|nr:lasso RiPP family leader peptide-containing protein [Streptomyces hainanensis]TDC78640.1 lasso RiPP family leader peptide-containing protein [Streptomyces hainanensis]
MSSYTAPRLTRVGTFRQVTKGLGGGPNDFWNDPAIFVIWP